MLACIVIIGGAIAVQHDIRSGLRVALFCFLFLQPIFAWVVRDWIRVFFISRTSHR